MNQIPNIEEKRQVLDATNQILALIPHIDGFNHSSINHKVDEIIHQQLQKARVQEKMRIKTLLEDLPAFTPCSDKTMGKVADEAKKPAYLTNYLERETVLKLLDHSELDQAELEGGLETK